MDELAAELGGAGLDRIEEMLRIRAGLTVASKAPYQHPYALHVPGLAALPWHDQSEFPWAGVVARSAAAIRSELGDLLREGVEQPYIEPFDAPLHGLDGTAAETAADRFGTATATARDWTALFLYRHGMWIDANARWLPSARRMIELTPYAPGEGLCSVLEPHGRIRLHSGGCNAVLTCHLPLVVPDGCALSVGLEARAWVENRLVVFDDTFLHKAWNDSEQRRVCLIWEVWHRDLTAIEIRALSVLYPRLMF